ncbi:hypothetical protein [Chondromyces crocatus]|uniref:DUF3352 domain-containing protein n=1 Tax=Chondromyces crocatus TaxID=52 RepID=A0A0K1E662_CHOCO|nr:hypothetical protein [Chondromyces crocatus]AKT36371.1 uncharacterized protein CMC5_004840 [Chondromyces crocatus]
MRTLLPLSFSTLLAVGCGPATPTPDDPTTPPSTSPPPAAVATSAPYDLSPVPEPGDVVGFARWANPANTITTLAGCAGVPPQLTEGTSRFAVEAILDALFPGATDQKQLAAVVALDAPVFAVTVLDPGSKRGRPLSAVSVGLTSLEGARGAVERLGTPTELSPGVWRVGGKEEAKFSCAIAAAAGSAPARLVCAERERDLVTLTPYVTRTLPSTPAEGRDLRAEIRLVPITDKFGGIARQQLRGIPILAQSQLTIGDPLFDSTVMETANALATEVGALIGDADKLSLEIGSDPTSCLTVSGALALRGNTSWLGATITDQARVMAPPPALFWRLPKDSEAATFSHGGDGPRLAPIFKSLGDLLEGYLGKEKIGGAADRKALADLLRKVPLSKDVTGVSASGGGQKQAPPRSDKAPAAQQELEQLLDDLLGWTLMGITEKPDAINTYFKNLVAAYNRPGLLNTLKKELKNDAKFLPVVKTVPAPKELGKNGFAVQISWKDLPAPNTDPLDGAGPTAKGKAAKITLDAYVYVMDEGTTTWMAVGTNKQELLKRLSMVKAGAPEDATLATRADLAQLKNAKVGSGGYFTIAPFTRSVGQSLGAVFRPLGGGTPALQQALGVLNGLPHKGAGPIFFSTLSEGGSAPKARFTINMTKPSLEDAGALIASGLKVAQSLRP